MAVASSLFKLPLLSLALALLNFCGLVVILHVCGGGRHSLPVMTPSNPIMRPTRIVCVRGKFGPNMAKDAGLVGCVWFSLGPLVVSC